MAQLVESLPSMHEILDLTPTPQTLCWPQTHGSLHVLGSQVYAATHGLLCIFFREFYSPPQTLRAFNYTIISHKNVAKLGWGDGLVGSSWKHEGLSLISNACVEIQAWWHRLAWHPSTGKRNERHLALTGQPVSLAESIRSSFNGRLWLQN